MWRPVALSAFLALLFMSSRSGHAPVEPGTNDTAKSNFGASAIVASEGGPDIDIDAARSSEYSKSVHGLDTPATRPSPGRDGDETREQDSVIETAQGETIPLPAPKGGAVVASTRVVVTEGEQKTALTPGDEVLRLMPPGPDFAAKVQRQLARLGCYRGRVDNIWGPMSRNAVARFNRVSGAKLPVKQPTRALMSSTRKAPDGFCSGKVASRDADARLAAITPNADLEALGKRPEYLPPWMRGAAMPETRKDVEDEPSEAEAQSDEPATVTGPARVNLRQRPNRQVQRRQVRRRAVQRRQVRRSRSSWQSNLAGWPGQ